MTFSEGDDGDPGLELDWSGVRQPAETSDEPETSKPASRHRAPTEADLAQARRIAAFGDPKGLVGVVFYSLGVGPRRRVLRRELRQTRDKLEEAEREVDRRYLEYARAVHARASEEHVPAIQPYVGGVDHAMLRKSQVEAGRARKRDREIQEQRVEKALLRLADAAMKSGHAKLAPRELQVLRGANREADRLDREVWLRELGIDLYDGKAVRRGRLILLSLVALVVAAGVAAWRSL